MFVAAGDDCTYLTSSGGVNWNEYVVTGSVIAGTEDFRAITHYSLFSDTYALVGANSSGKAFMCISTDLVIFSCASNFRYFGMYAIDSYSADFLADGGVADVAYCKSCCSSISNWYITDVKGIYWSIYGLANNYGTFIQVGSNGTIYETSCLNNFNSFYTRTSGTTNDLYEAIADLSKFVVVGENGTVLTAPTYSTSSWTTKTRVHPTGTICGIVKGSSLYCGNLFTALNAKAGIMCISSMNTDSISSFTFSEHQSYFAFTNFDCTVTHSLTT